MVQIKNNEQLLSVKSLVNNTMLDFTILEVTTNKDVYNVSLEFKPVFTKTFGYVYKYKQTLNDWLQSHNIKTDLYDFNNNIDVMPKDIHNPLGCFKIRVFNNI